MRCALVLVVALLVAAPAFADDYCTSGRGPTRRIDLDVSGAELHSVFRLLATIGHVNIVVPDDVQGTITLRMRRQPWNRVLCTIAAMRKLRVRNEQGVLVVVPRQTSRTQGTPRGTRRLAAER